MFTQKKQSRKLLLTGSLVAGVLLGTTVTPAASLFNFNSLGNGAELRSELLNSVNDKTTGGSLDMSCGAKTSDSKAKDAKCGEGKCGDSKTAHSKAKDAKCGEKKATMDSKSKDASCGENKAAVSDSAKAAKKAMKAAKKAKKATEATAPASK